MMPQTGTWPVCDPLCDDFAATVRRLALAALGARPRRAMLARMDRRDGMRGQATAEYVALVTLVAVVLALAAGLTSGGLASSVLSGMQRGLCRVVGASCSRPIAPRADLVPCPLERSSRVEELSEQIAVLQLGASGTLTAERMSDGRVTVTLADGGSAAGEVGVGVRLRLGSRTIGATAGGALGATWTSGRSWTFADAATAGRFVSTYGSKATISGKLVDGIRSRCSLLCDAVGWRPHPQLPRPDETYAEGGATAALTASLGIGRVGGQLAGLLGRRVQRDGTTTWYLQLDGAASAALRLPALGGTGGTSGAAVLSYTVGPRGRPRTLTARVGGAADAAAQLHAERAVGRIGAGGGHGEAVELEATLDLSDAGNRIAATAALDALVHPGSLATLPSRLRALAARVADHGQLDRRVYALETRSGGFGASIRAGLEAGAGFERTTRGLRLLSAETRLPGLPFLPRDDCRPA